MPSQLTQSADLVLGSYLKTAVTATSTTYINSGLAVQLAANTPYFIDLVWSNTANGDGMKFKLVYSGSVGVNLFVPRYGVSTNTDPFEITNEVTLNTVDENAQIQGLFVTGSAGTLYFQFAKATDVTDDTPLSAGSCLVARRI